MVTEMSDSIFERRKSKLAEQLRELADDVEDGSAIPSVLTVSEERGVEYPRNGERWEAPHFQFIWNGELTRGEPFVVKIPETKISSDEIEELGL